MSDEYTLEVKGLDQLLKALKAKPPVARVGILGSSPRKEGEQGRGSSNAEVGAAHEFGTSTLPQRSFLRAPISEHLQSKMESSGALDRDTLDQVIKKGSVMPWLGKVTKLAENIVNEAFDTGGFGKWKQSDMTHKKNHQTLVETQQLRNSISSEVKE